MNIDVVARVRKPVRGESQNNLEIEGTSLSAGPGGPQFNFQQLYSYGESTYDVFKKSVEPLMNLFVAGFNTSLLVVGSTGSGRSYTTAGESMSNSGIVSLLFDYLFKKIGEDDRYMYDSRVTSKQRVTLQMYELYNEQIKDLLRVPGVQLEFQELDESAESGVFVKNAERVTVKDAGDGSSFFRQAWARRTEAHTDHGPARKHAAVVTHIDLTLRSADSPLPSRSRFTVAVLPGVEKLVEDSGQIRQREGPTLGKSLIAFSNLVATLSNQGYPDRVVNYRESKLTRLLQEELGGNCKTRVLVCVSPNTEPAVLTPLLRMCTQLAAIKNFPILNDGFAQQLVTQHRARQLHQELILGGGGAAHEAHYQDAADELRRVKTENLQLRDKNERLHQKMESLQGKFGTMATNKADLSSQLLMTEEEKLQVSKTLVEMQIENNKLKEEYESAKFELTNKIIQLENDLVEATMERDKQTKIAKNSKDKLTELERDRKDLADEYVVLKSNYLAMTKAHEREVDRNEELSVELLNLVNAKATLLRQMDNMKLATGVHEDPDAEIDRVRNILSRLNSKRVDDASQNSRERVEKELFGNQQRFQIEMDRVRNQYDKDQETLHQKLVGLRKELKESRDVARDRQRSISELNAQMITLRAERDALKSQFNRTQHKLKDISEEYRSRLVKYVEDVAEFVDTGGLGPSAGRSEPQMQKYVSSMLGDLTKAHKRREEQLSDAAVDYKKRLEVTVRDYERLLVAYRSLRHQVESLEGGDLDLGPDELTFRLSEEQLASSQQREISRLREELHQLNNELETLKFQTKLHDKNTTKDTMDTLRSNLDTENWSSLRKQLREFTLNTQQELEMERAALLTQNAMLAQQVEELQAYVDTHLARYREEITRLRQQLGVPDGGLSPRPQLRA